MKAKVLYISEKGNHALVSIKKAIGPFMSEKTGWLEITADIKKGDEFELDEEPNFLQFKD